MMKSKVHMENLVAQGTLVKEYGPDIIVYHTHARARARARAHTIFITEL